MAEQNNARESQWYFNAEQLQNSPSRKCGIDADKELQYRQQTAYLIQEMGQHLRVSQLCINTAIVYMHRFYAFHSFTHFPRNGIAAASLFLAAKVEEQPRKLEHVIRVVNASLNEDITKEAFLEQAQDLVFNENVLLQTLGFDVAIDHPHTHVVKTCHLVKAGKDLAQTSYFMASNSLHLTTMCLQYKPTVVACFCIHLACKWSSWEIPNSTEGRPWFHYVDKSVTTDLLGQLTEEFIQIYQKSPSRLKNKLNSIKALVQGTKQQEDSAQQKGGNSSNVSSNAQVHRSSSTGSGSSSGGHHHHHHHHHHSKAGLAPGQPQFSTSAPTISAGENPRQQQTKQSAYNSSRSGSKHSNQSIQPQQQQQQQQPLANNGQQQHRSASGVNSGMDRQGNGSRAVARPPITPQQQQPTSAPYSINKISSQQKYNSQPPPPYSADNSMSSVGSKSNSPTQGNRLTQSANAKQPLFMGNYPDNKKSLISDEAFQFSIDDLRDAQDSQESNQMLQTNVSTGPHKSNKMQSIFCPDWREEYSSGNTEHAKMNLPIGSTGDTKAPMSMMTSGGSHQHQKTNQKPGSSSSSGTSSVPAGHPGGNAVSGNPSATRKTEKKAEQQPHKSHSASGSLPAHSSNSLISSHSMRHNMPMGGGVNKGTPGSSTKRPYDDMVSGGGVVQPDLSGSCYNSGQQQEYRDAKSRKTEIQGGDLQVGVGYDLQKPNPLDKDFNDYRDTEKAVTSGFTSISNPSASTAVSCAATSGTTSSSTATSASKFSGYGNSLLSIETNPDLVSSLLKESLNNTEHAKPFTTLPMGITVNSGGSTSADRYGRTESAGNFPQGTPKMGASESVGDAVSTVSSSQLDQLINAPLQPFQQIRAAPNVSEGSNQALHLLQGTAPMGSNVVGAGDEHHRHKSEKKKKKEKHKNKEKDRGSKEERKKHKKDKERHKERHQHYAVKDEGETGGVLGPIKLKIPRLENLTGSMGGGTNESELMSRSFKIKIPRNQEPIVPLKIKISKEKLIKKEEEDVGGSNEEMATSGGLVASYHKKKEKEKFIKKEY